MALALTPAALKDWHTLKPSSFAAYCLMCEVHDSRAADVYLDQEKAESYGIGKSAYYYALTELQDKKWIESAGKRDGKKRWRLIKGKVSANVENSANAENQNSANVEKQTQNSANVEKSSPHTKPKFRKRGILISKNSANVENPPHPLIRIKAYKKEKLIKEIEDAREPAEVPPTEHGNNDDQNFDYPRTAIGRQTGISVCEILPPVLSHSEHIAECGRGMRERLKTPKRLPNEAEWIAAFEFYFDNEYSPDDLLQTFDAMERIRILKEAPWRVTPKVVKNAIGTLEMLENEIYLLENEGEYATINQSKSNGFESEHQRRDREARERTQFFNINRDILNRPDESFIQT